MHTLTTLPIAAFALLTSVDLPIDGGVDPSHSEAIASGCSGCHASSPFGTAGGGVTFPSEPTLLNGQCTGEPGHCTGSDCSLDGRLAFTNNTHTTLWWSDDGGASTHELLSGESEVIYFNGDSVKCSNDGDTTQTYTFYTNPNGSGQVTGAFYTLQCSQCAG